MRIFYEIALSIAIAMSIVGIVRARAKIGNASKRGSSGQV
jgi:hypothetical protein